MKTKLLLITGLLTINFALKAQWYQQYFDGADTSAQNAVIITINPDTNNIWQVGPPQKTIFNVASTFPNALITDTINNYPPNNTSSFGFTTIPNFSNILAFQWSQKIDFDSTDGGIIEFSTDTGQTWQNVVNNPYIYNFYGYLNESIDTLFTGEQGFTGTDSTWRDIWLCFDANAFFNLPIQVRFTFKSDSTGTGKEGWMIDNLSVHPTWIHTINEKEHSEYMLVYPNPTNGIVNIWTKKIEGFHIIENMQLVDMQGRVIEEWNNVPTKFFININSHANGTYYLKVRTNVQSQVFPIVLNKN